MLPLRVTRTDGQWVKESDVFKFTAENSFTSDIRENENLKMEMSFK